MKYSPKPAVLTCRTHGCVHYGKAFRLPTSTQQTAICPTCASFLAFD